MADLRRISIKTQKTVDEINSRLGRIEAHLGIGVPAEPEPEPEPVPVPAGKPQKPTKGSEKTDG